MSLTKRWMEEEEARRYYTSEDSVCARCFYDEGIQNFIQSHRTAHSCSVCTRKSKKLIAAPADQVFRFILERLHRHYENADGNAYFDKETWDYIVPTWDMEELVIEVMEDAAPYETLEWIQEHLKDDVTYCERGWQVLSPGDALSSSWETFSKAIKHETRFMFFSNAAEDDFGEPFLVKPAQMLDALGEAILRCNLLKTLKAKTIFYRVRGHDAGEKHTDGPSLGPTPEALAHAAGRMNAPGIVVAYAAFDEDTALSEATGDYPEWSVGKFELLEDIRVLDLTEIQGIPSIFEEGPRESLRFLHKFAKDVSQPFTPDPKAHVEYTPTQVVSEYLRHRLRDKKKQSVRGIIYWSAKAEGTKNLAIFMTEKEVEGYSAKPRLALPPLIGLLRATERVRPTTVVKKRSKQ